MSIKKLFICFFIFICFTLEAKELQKVSIQLNWKHQFEFAGIYAAKEMGFYEAIGLDVEIKEFDNKINIIDDIKTNRTTYGIYDLSLLSYYDKKNPIILLANYFKKSGLVIISNQNILTPYDLKDKTILANEYQLKNSILSTLLNKFEIKTTDFKKIVPHDFKVDKFINGEVDAMTAYVSNELYYIKKRNIPYNILDVSNYGIYGYSENIFSSKEEVTSNPLRTENFINATTKGWKYALENKEKLVNIIYNKYTQRKTKDALFFEANEIEKLIMPKIFKIGSIKEDFLENALNEAKANNLINKDISTKDLIFTPLDSFQSTILTKDEILYLEKKEKIYVCIDPNWMPFEKLDNGEFLGMSKDYIALLEEKINIPIQLYPTKDWSSSIAEFKKNSCDILSLVMPTSSRKKYMNFSSTYLESPLVIATKADELFISNVEEIINIKTLALVKDYAFVEILKKKYPNNKIIEVESIDKGLELVAKGEIFGLIDTSSTIGYKIQTDFLGELKIAGKLDEKLSLSLGVRKDDLMLLNILDKALLSIDKNKKHEILNKWVNVKFDRGTDYSLLWKIVLIFIFVIIVLMYRHNLLLKKNNKIKQQQVKLKEQNIKLKETRERLEETLEGFHTLLNSTMEAVIVFEKGYCVDANEIGVKLFGFEHKDEVIGKEIKTFFSKEEQDKISVNQYKSTTAYEANMIKEDGTIFPAYVQGKNTVLNGKNIRISTALDITYLKNQEKLLLQQSKMASLGEMIGNIAHQWRQPLSLVSTLATGLKFKIEIDQYDAKLAIKDLDTLNDTVQYLSCTIDDFRNFFLPDKKRVFFRVKELLEKNLIFIETLLKTNEIELVLNCDNNLEIETYKNELLQAILNILNNSCDALIQLDKKRLIQIDVFKENEVVIIIIKDNANGIDETILDKVFEPYFTTKHQSNGTGIGLYMTHQIITKHIKGKIIVENVNFEHNNLKEKGAMFTLEIPIS